MSTKSLIIAALFAGVAFHAGAAENTPLNDCVDLGADQEIVRAGSSQSFLLRNGTEHYLVGFRGECSSLATASKVEIVTNGTDDRLCASGTKVKTNRALCPVGKVEVIDAEQFAARKRRATR